MSKISKRSRVVKFGVRHFKPKTKSYNLHEIQDYRRRFDRSMRLSSPVPKGTDVNKSVISGVNVEWLTFKKPTNKLMVYIHGGGFVLGSPRTYRGMMASIGKTAGVDVLAIDYRLAPEHPYPAALEDIEKVWNKVVEDKNNKYKTILMAGDSAGAHLALVTALRLKDKGLKLPSCLILISPALDTSFSGETIKSKAKEDPLLSEKMIRFLMNAYIQEHDLNDPYVSPLTANLSGLPPLLIHIGSHEILLDDSKKLASKSRNAGNHVEIFIGEELWHNWHMFTYLPESKKAFADIKDFINRNT